MFLNGALPEHGPTPTDQFDPKTLWWAHERLHRRGVLDGLPGLLERIQSERDELEANFLMRTHEVLNGGDPADRRRVVSDCWAEARKAEGRWLEWSTQRTRSDTRDSWRAEWLKMNEVTGIAT